MELSRAGAALRIYLAGCDLKWLENLIALVLGEFYTDFYDSAFSC